MNSDQPLAGVSEYNNIIIVIYNYYNYFNFKLIIKTLLLDM